MGLLRFFADRFAERDAITWKTRGSAGVSRCAASPQIRQKKIRCVPSDDVMRNEEERWEGWKSGSVLVVWGGGWVSRHINTTSSSCLLGCKAAPLYKKMNLKNSVIFYLGVEIFKHGCALKNNILSLKIAFIQDIFAPILSANLFKHHHNAEEPGRPAHLHRLWPALATRCQARSV